MIYYPKFLQNSYLNSLFQKLNYLLLLYENTMFQIKM